MVRDNILSLTEPGKPNGDTHLCSICNEIA